MMMTVEKARTTLYRYSGVPHYSLALVEYLDNAGLLTGDFELIPWKKLRKRFGWDNNDIKAALDGLMELMPVFDIYGEYQRFRLDPFDRWPESIYKFYRYGVLYSIDDV